MSRTIIRPGGRRPRNNSSNAEPTQTNQRPRRNRTNLASMAREREKPSLVSNNLFQRLQPQKHQPEQFEHQSNPLLSLLSPLILLVSKVKLSPSSVDINELRAHAIEHIEYYRSIDFGMEAPVQGKEEISYGLCCLLDEIVLNTPWGAKSEWSNGSLLVTFHKEAWGGERFFSHLDVMSDNPGKYLNVIELYYCFLEMGFEGKYRQANDGMRALQVVKNNTYLLLEKYQNIEPMPLSDNWKGADDGRNSILKVVPQWVIWASVFVLMIITYLVFNLMLSNQSDPIKRQLVTLTDASIVQRTPISTGIVTSFQPDLHANDINVLPLLQEAFAKEITDGLLTLQNRPVGVSVRLTDSNLFSSGSNKLNDDYVDIVKKMANTLTDHRIRMEVTGHSDDIPIRTMRYQDNWALSAARAEAVKDLIQPLMNPRSQVFARGLADTINLVPNSNAENRAINRRVEILIRN